MNPFSYDMVMSCDLSPVSNAEIAAALDQIVQRVGGQHISGSRSTGLPDLSGVKCIQGELLEQLGRGTSLSLLPVEVAALLGRRNDPRLVVMLSGAMCANDSNLPWGYVVSKAKLGLAA